MSSRTDITIFWFRRDFRFEDNIGLLHALDSKYPVMPIFIFDPEILSKFENKNDPRVKFILDQLLSLKRSLEKSNSTLHIYYDKPGNVFVNLRSNYNIKAVFANRDYEPHSISRDLTITNLLNEQKIPFYLFKDHVIFEGQELLKKDGLPYKIFTPYKKIWLQKLLDLGAFKTDGAVPFEKFLRSDPSTLPVSKSLNFQTSTTTIPSKEIPISIIRKYDKTRDYPALNGTSKLGIHLRFGTISIRSLVNIAFQNNPTFLSELIWRDFYSSILQHFPHVAFQAFNKKYDLIPWKNNEIEFKKWAVGKTGYPMVDAGMRELNQTGYMHNRVRMITSSFLSKHLLIDWRWGEAYFASKLLDFELASNNGGWQWAAGTGTDAQPYFRVFNPEAQAQRFDPDSKYIKKWIPEFGTSAYAQPIVEHKSARLRAIETYKSVVSK